MNLGELIRLYRSLNNIGIRDFSNSLGISSSTLSRFENGKNIDSDTFSKIFKWCIEKRYKS